MSRLYGNIISAAEAAIEEFDETAELLEYPEVMADKAYYLSLLNKFNSLSFIKDRLDSLKAAEAEEEQLVLLLSEAKDEDERSAVFREISLLKRRAANLSAEIAGTLGRSVTEAAYCRIKLKGNSNAVFEKFVNLLKSDLIRRGIRITELKSDNRQFDFRTEGEGALSRILPLCGCHRINAAGNKCDWLCVAATPVSDIDGICDSDIKIEVFHSHGAGGQNINKVETAVRAIYLPTGLAVVCQDERSQLKNKNRAIENLKRRVSESRQKQEKQRIEEDVNSQFSIKNTAISFDAVDSSLTDTRLFLQNKIPLSATAEEFTRYLDAVAVSEN